MWLSGLPKNRNNNAGTILANEDNIDADGTSDILRQHQDPNTSRFSPSIRPLQLHWDGLGTQLRVQLQQKCQGKAYG